MLELAHTRGVHAAFARFKVARGATGMPMGTPMHPAVAGMHADLHAMAPAASSAPPAAPAASWPDMHKGVANQQAANVQTHPAQLPPARAFEGSGAAAAGGGAPVPPAATGGAGGFMRGGRRALGLGALAAGGAMAYGLHRQNTEDREKFPLTYAPMSGSFMQ